MTSMSMIPRKRAITLGGRRADQKKSALARQRTRSGDVKHVPTLRVDT